LRLGPRLTFLRRERQDSGEVAFDIDEQRTAERDLHFEADKTLSAYADAARKAERIEA
jgi:hypothetical protein